MLSGHRQAGLTGGAPNPAQEAHQLSRQGYSAVPAAVPGGAVFGSRLIAHRVSQNIQMAAISRGPPDGRLVHGLAHLRHARGLYWSFGLMKIETCIIPLKPAELEKLSRFAFLVSQELLIAKIRNRS